LFIGAAHQALRTLSGLDALPGFDRDEATPAQVRAYQDTWRGWWDEARAGFSPELKLALKRAYRLVFNSDLTVSQGIARARVELPQIAEVETFLQFIEASQRGVMV